MVGEKGRDWRPDNWEQIRRELANTPNVWSPAGPNLTHIEQIVEATASRILEAHEASLVKVFLPFPEVTEILHESPTDASKE